MLLKILLEKSRLGQISRKCRQCWEQNQDQSESKQQFLRFCFSCIFASKTRRKTSSWIGCDCWNLQNSSACLGQETPSCTSLTKTLSIHRQSYHPSFIFILLDFLFLSIHIFFFSLAFLHCFAFRLLLHSFIEETNNTISWQYFNYTLIAFVSAVKKTTKIKKSKSRYQGSPDLAANTKNYANLQYSQIDKCSLWYHHLQDH